MRLFFSSLFVLLAIPAASAQTSVGAQIGDPTGLALKIGSGPGAVLVGVGWDFVGDDAINVEGHYLLHSRGLQGNRDVKLFYGPGLFASFGDIQKDAFGVSLGVGLETELIPRVEVYGLLSPRLQIVDKTDFDVGGGLGARVQL